MREVAEESGGRIEMQDIIAQLMNTMEGTPLIAIGAAFGLGILSIIASPCHLASIPLLVGFVNDQGDITKKRAFLLSSSFAGGIFSTILILTALLHFAERAMMEYVGPYANYAAAGILLLVGLHLFDIIPAPWSGPGQIKYQRKGLIAAFVMGFLFGLAVGPCTFGYMGAMLGMSLAYGALLFVVFGIGHCGVIIFAGTFTEIVQKYMNWNERSSGAAYIKKICGVLVLIGGLYMIYTAP
jgi:cytochrome c-type biogenesis protein